MNKKELKEVRLKNDLDLAKLIESKREALTKTLLEINMQKEKNVKKAKNQKLDLAQLLTIVKEKEYLKTQK